MRLSVVTVDEAAALSVRVLGLDDASIGLDSPEAIAASLRRAASFLCPTTPRMLVDTVRSVLNPVLAEPVTRLSVTETLDRLISIGDLLELKDSVRGLPVRMLYLGPPSFVERSGGRFLVTGVRPLGEPLLSSDFAVEHESHIRSVDLCDDEVAIEQLRAAGLHHISKDKWIAKPSVLSAHEYVSNFRKRLHIAGEAGSIEGLMILDPSSRPTYYRGRWREPGGSDSGDFVGRRSQAYGADAWCFVRLVEGSPKRLIDLPVEQVTTPARDDAWRLQAAIDCVNGRPLSFRSLVAPSRGPSFVNVDFFSPVPSWVERYLGLVGMAVERARGSLLSYRLPASALSELENLLRETLWMTAATEQEIQ